MKYEHKLGLRVILALILIYPVFNFIITPLTKYLVYFISLTFFSISLNNNIFQLGNYHLEFVSACAAISAYYLIFILVIFTKDLSFKNTFKIFFTGALLILIMNLLRIELMFFILTNYSSNLFDKVHLFFWEIVSTLYVAGVWIFLVKYYKIKSIPFYSDLKKLIKR
ncbi:pacearchaeosortase [Candidatus Woesearchaeota archaeon]|nr:pacearchaeosortase [Candidatus Woesearchaeota archaeon]